MEKVRYMISDAATMAGVESHVLRYWEDELDLNIPRNEMGHRYYTRENILEFQRIKELKEQGYQLKAIRTILHNEGEVPPPTAVGTAGSAHKHTETDSLTTPANAAPTPTVKSKSAPASKSAVPSKTVTVPAVSKSATPASVDNAQPVPSLSAEERMEQFRELMSDIVGQAISQNNEELSQNISQDVHETVLKEMNYLFREQEDAEEERFKKLDAAIRGSVRKKRGLFDKSDKPKPSKAERNAAKQKAKASLT